MFFCVGFVFLSMFCYVAGAVPLMANEQRAIGNSYRGQLDAAALQELYRRTACTSHGHEAVLKRARHEARMHQ
jgi:hypothetical protein